MKRKNIVDVLISLFVLLFIYTAANKLINFEYNVRSMHNQPLVTWLVEILIYAVPISEILIVILLILNKTKLLGLYLFTAMMFIFSGYVALVLSNYYDRVPCSCGGLMKELGWKSHLALNITFSLLGLLAIYLTKKGEDNMSNESESYKRISISN